MTSGYLSTYQIPLITTTDKQPKHVCEPVSVKITSHPAARMAPNRYYTAAKVVHGDQPVMMNTMEHPSAIASQQRKLKRKMYESVEVEGNNLVLFQGRDESYPDELNKLIHPLSCQLCKSQMTSMKSAKDHYESKAHDRHISAWLAKNYTEMGLETPPIKRLVKQGPTGPNAFHCNLCDLPLTSMTHARQHYAGRKHQLVVQKRSKPSGAGYYNSDGNWVRTGTKAEVMVDDGRYGIGEMFLRGGGGGDMHDISSDMMDTAEEQQHHFNAVDESLTCKICNISVTSASQIQMHLDGAKHQKKLRAQNLEGDPNAQELLKEQQQSIAAACAIDINGDLSMYRTPSGSYYCKLCNKAMNHISILQQHLQGKKHLKTVRQQAEEMVSPQ
ncbi:PREDICTED: zinc finger protein 346 [Drosophila arizonae]|uniref:Zinc finger protein 346 n=1 Tax=Drosophila arizonae TaxID=7263 RepID=A0ABM1PYU5_DROAR|nr:PREDICTED: zinc finger protein 346 [Drosophila arizonae]